MHAPGKGKGDVTEERNDAIFTIVQSFKIEQSFYEDNRTWRKRRNSGRKSEILCFLWRYCTSSLLEKNLPSLGYLCYNSSVTFWCFFKKKRYFYGLKIITFRISFIANTWFLIKYIFIKKIVIHIFEIYWNIKLLIRSRYFFYTNISISNI